MNPPDIRVTSNHHLITICWALLIAKCFTFEYLVTIYHVPINSALYIWTLSIFMALVASGVYWKITRNETIHAEPSSRAALIWGIAIISALFLVIVAFCSSVIPAIRLPALFSILIGIGYGAQARQAKHQWALFSALGWGVAAALLFMLPSPLPLVGFAFGLLAFTAIPGLIQYLRLRRATSRG